MYDIILADPPWKYDAKSTTDNRKVPYVCMTNEELYALEVSKIANENCILFLWTTCPFLQTATNVVNAWGFRYYTVAFSWVKRNKKKDSFFWGMGNWTRSNTELCLLGLRGKPKKRSSSVHQIVYEPIGQHSRKPPVVRERIVELCGDLKRVELFATELVEGWDSVGYDANGMDVRDFVSEVGGDNSGI